MRLQRPYPTLSHKEIRRKRPTVAAKVREKDDLRVLFSSRTLPGPSAPSPAALSRLLLPHSALAQTKCDFAIPARKAIRRRVSLARRRPARSDDPSLSVPTDHVR